MPELTSDWLTVRDHPIATADEMGRYVYKVPEDEIPPPVITTFIAGQDVDPGDLYAAAAQARAAVSHSESASTALDLLRRRLRDAFPELH